MLTSLDYLVICVYLAGVAWLGIRIAGRQTSTEDYFLGGRNLPWWVVCFSIVATETSTLTIIGLPAIAYGGSLTFLQLTLGYLLGRSIVSLVLLPRYYERPLGTTYEYLGNRFGDRMRGVASVTFLVTRLLADGVRLFATAIPIKVMLLSAGVEFSYFSIILVLGMVTVLYTIIGGIKAVVWIDVIQLAIYCAGGAVAMLMLAAMLPPGWWEEAVRAGKTTVIDAGFDRGMTTVLTNPYVLPTAVLGGAVFSIASHGTDQLIVQRLLACRTLRDSQRALVCSALVVMLQFALFLLIGLMLWSYYGGAEPAALGLARADEVFPRFVVEGLPAGVSGLLLAGIIAAAMSTLSSTVNSLASSSLMDIFQRLARRAVDGAASLRVSRGLTLFWGVMLVGFASLFEDSSNAVVELGLTIASYTYGALLGVFALAIGVPRSREGDALAAFLCTIVAMVFIVFCIWHDPAEGWVIVVNPGAEAVAERDLGSIAWTWYPLIGAAITVTVGGLMSAARQLAVQRRSAGRSEEAP